MKEVFLHNKRTALIPASSDAEEALYAFPLGAVLRCKITQKRSLPHHNFYWAFIGECFNEWPENHGHKPMDGRHLHSWLAVKAGYLEMLEFEAPESASEREIEFSVKMAKSLADKLSGGRPSWPKVIGHKIYFAWPKSIAFENMDEDDFKRFTMLVFTLIYSEAGIDVDDYYKKWQSKHGDLKVRPERFVSPVENGLYFC